MTLYSCVTNQWNSFIHTDLICFNFLFNMYKCKSVINLSFFYWFQRIELFLFIACCKCFLFRLPYGTITASLMAVCGMIVSGCSIAKATKISEKMFFDLLQRNYLWSVHRESVDCVSFYWSLMFSRQQVQRS